MKNSIPRSRILVLKDPHMPVNAGAIYMDNGSGGKTLTVKDSLFYGSVAARSGGAIYMYSEDGYAAITDSSFVGSGSTKVGGSGKTLKP